MPETDPAQSERQEPYWVRACPTCKRQLRDSLSTCCGGEYGKTIYLAPAEESGRLRRLLNEMDGYVGHREDCDSGSGAPECSCGFDDLYTKVRAAVRGERG